MLSSVSWEGMGWQGPAQHRGGLGLCSPVSAQGLTRGAKPALVLHCKKEERVGFSSGVFVSGDGGGNPEGWNLGLNLAAQILQRGSWLGLSWVPGWERLPLSPEGCGGLCGHPCNAVADVCSAQVLPEPSGLREQLVDHLQVLDIICPLCVVTSFPGENQNLRGNSKAVLCPSA